MINYTAMPSLADLYATYAIDAASPSGLSRIKASRGRNGKAGPVVSIGSDGYYRMKFNGQFYRTHRVIYYMHTGIDPAELVVDHIDGDCLNNKVENLRSCTFQENLWNAKGKPKRSGLPKGITKLRSGDYRVSVTAGGKLFESDLKNFKAATNCVRAIRKRYHGEFARN